MIHKEMIQYARDIPRGDVQILRPGFLHLFLPMSTQLPLRQQEVRRGDMVVFILVECTARKEPMIGVGESRECMHE